MPCHPKMNIARPSIPSIWHHNGWCHPNRTNRDWLTSSKATCAFGTFFLQICCVQHIIPQQFKKQYYRRVQLIFMEIVGWLARECQKGNNRQWKGTTDRHWKICANKNKRVENAESMPKVSKLIKFPSPIMGHFAPNGMAKMSTLKTGTIWCPTLHTFCAVIALSKFTRHFFFFWYGNYHFCLSLKSLNKKGNLSLKRHELPKLGDWRGKCQFCVFLPFPVIPGPMPMPGRHFIHTHTHTHTFFSSISRREVTALAWDTQGDVLAIANGRTPTLVMYECSTGQIQTVDMSVVAAAKALPTLLRWCPTSATLLVGDNRGNFVLFDHRLSRCAQIYIYWPFPSLWKIKYAFACWSLRICHRRKRNFWLDLLE